MRKSLEENSNKPVPSERPRRKINAFLVMGIGAGVAIGVPTDNLTLDIAMGVGLGLIIGAALDRWELRYADLVN